MSITPLGVMDFYIMVALAGEPQYGYGVQQKIMADSQAGYYARPASIYKTLQRMLRSGWIEVVASSQSQGPHRITYQLTPAGRRLLKAEATALRHVAQLAIQRIG